ncbi:MAG: RNA polymerase sigma factor [Acidimicrobiia bacterium]|nr:RNA polymerase sigma factor [Acidimicrobiia bacterium]
MGHSVADGSDRELVESLYDRLRGFAAVTAPWHVEPDDLLQEVLVRALSQGPLSRLENPLAYLRRSIINLSIDHARQHDRRRPARSESALGDLSAADRYPSDLGLLSELSPRARAVVYLAEVEGFRYSEISEMLNCSESTARVTAMRARRRLRNLLSAEVGSG